ncbi:hypothetical protein F4809DRAFT_453763 [Biscogniauxia mediterranea]|nr:hypothetical protein F4809DRAFT_453763 [Biscogniauxia mediterranea]
MASASNKRSPTPEHNIPEDPDTAAARKELRQTVISEKPDLSAMSATNPDHRAPSATSGLDKASSKATTPDRDLPDTADNNMKEHMSSPKKKRARDEVDEPKDTAANTNGDVSPVGENGSITLNRTNRSEPEKKRPRDVSSEIKKDAEAPISPKSDEAATKSPEPQKPSTAEKDQKVTSASAFNSSGLSGFSTQTSPFLQAGSGTKTLSSFASTSAAPSPFGLTSSTPTSIFGTSNGSSAFARVGGSSTTTFGSSVFSGGFGSSSLSGSKLTTFSTPGGIFKSSEPPRPFGAPANDEEDEGAGDGAKSKDKEGDDSAEKPTEEDKEKSAGAEDKKKPKLQRVAVDDGEAGEVTLLQVRAKIYHLDKASSSWKERGAGNLKINVPLACVTIDEESGAPIPGTFDASSLEGAESKVVRLVMRQDSTHRLILNTVIIPAMEFQEKSTVKATCVLFTAIENEGAVSIQIKMNAANAKSFLNEVGKVQRELQSV